MAKATKTKPKLKTTKKATTSKRVAAKAKASRVTAKKAMPKTPAVSSLASADATVLDRLWETIVSRREVDPSISHSARLLSRGTAKIAQKFGEEAVECVIEAVSGASRSALVGESADVLYHLLVLWVDAEVAPEEVWAELMRREGISGVAEKASRLNNLRSREQIASTKIP
jgi:phosphoribosyl-ATP pyrophosphohydrolase